MSQYSNGYIYIKQDSQNIINGIDTKFLSNTKKGDILVIDRHEGIPYTIKKVISDTQIEISSVYTGSAFNIRLQYSITCIFSTLFDLPIIHHQYKHFATLATLLLRMLDSIMKNLGFRFPDEPQCISGLIGLIEPPETQDLGAKWSIAEGGRYEQ